MYSAIGQFNIVDPRRHTGVCPRSSYRACPGIQSFIVSLQANFNSGMRRNDDRGQGNFISSGSIPGHGVSGMNRCKSGRNDCR